MMMKLTFKNVLLYIFLKYLFFSVFLMFKNKDFKLLEIDNLIHGHTFVYFFLFMLPLPIVSMIIFSAPIYYSFKLKRFFLFALLIGVVFVAEYFLYTHLASTSNLMNGVYLEVISILLFLLFFYRHTVLTFNQHAK
jgi:hypothetical protein